MEGKSVHLMRGGLASGLISRSNNELREVSRTHSSEETPVMGVERRGIVNTDLYVNRKSRKP